MPPSTIEIQMRVLSGADILRAARQLAELDIAPSFENHTNPKCYAIPTGGISAALAVRAFFGFEMVDSPEQADFFIDDLVDTGKTRDAYAKRFPGIPFFALFDKQGKTSPWYVFPWEKDGRSADDSIVGTLRNRLAQEGVPFLANDNLFGHLSDEEFQLLLVEVEKRSQALLDALLIDTEHDHNTKGTAHRMAKLYLNEVFAGRFKQRPAITDFPNVKKLDELYTTGPITIRSACSHHLCPIMGHCWIGIIPGERVIGLSKFNRLVEWLASRPQIQEELVVQIADEIEKACKPKGLAVVVKASHTCMTWRGVKENSNAMMTTSVMRGALRDKPEARSEFLAFVSSNL